MSSKMVPLWLVFNNANPEADDIYVIFKSGDDLRQDILTLQMLKIMDKLWLAGGQNMRLTPYKCIATGVNDNGEGVGMIEVVRNSDTTSGIQLKYGGSNITSAFKNKTIDSFLQTHNKSPASYEKARENFMPSCAGYCVATFVLGIGDRHNGNIMVNRDGHLFHIDFGHFLGNFKQKYGIKRERAPFVFTPEMAYVIGGKSSAGKSAHKNDNYKEFLKKCSEAFRILRENCNIIETLFLLMVSAGMPELMEPSDITYMQEKLFLDLTPEKADKEIHKAIDQAKGDKSRQLDNMFHNLKHGQ